MSQKSNSNLSQALKITAQPAQSLSKVQAQFNDITAQIEKTREAIHVERAKLEELGKLYDAHVTPQVEAILQCKVEAAFGLDALLGQEKFSKQQRKRISTCILELIEEGLDRFPERSDWADLYRKWRGNSLEEDQALEQAARNSFMAELLEQIYGVELDRERWDNDADYRATFEDQAMGNQQGGMEDWEKEKVKHKRAKGSTRKKEAQRKAAEELKSKSVRSVYISLAKLLHPDLEADPAMKLAKEEEMKRISEAYEKDDLTTLLKMEMEWLQKESNHLGTLPEEKLKLYVEVLKDQLQALKAEKNELIWEPRYAHLADYAHLKTASAIRKIKDRANWLLHVAKDWRLVKVELTEPDAKKNALNFVNEFFENY